MEFLPLVAIALVFWLLIVRPAGKRQKEIAKLQAALKVGDRVLLSSGIFAVVRETSEDRVRVEIADGVVVEVARGAVAAIEQASVEQASVDEARSGDDGFNGPTTPGA
ncbi:preprotein translocase subunit YajC [Nocardioides campestrisoli]|uniref:preprotein translocase subunit YajC n=1 Tax=Nocardioides campestrisoli TaxID=2736757 RepID=UPI00163DE00D|nr:preprotein translocase subunit YajC [Nocardioides campestrisoli]